MMRSTTTSLTIKTVVFLALAVVGAADARAGFTSFNTSKHATEMTHAQILGHTYGGTFAASGGVNFTNGAVTAQRLDDGGGGPGAMTNLSASTGGGVSTADQCWGDGVLSARAIARFAGSDQIFGIVDGDAGGSFERLFDVTGWGTNVTGSADNVDLSGQNFRFARAGRGDATFTSSDADNFFGADQMVSYHVTGPNGLSKYVLFFEDVGAHLDSDWDFNDMVIEVTSLSAPSAIPLPPAVWSGLAVLITGGLWNARARLRAWFR